jgi:dTMP kinase
METGGSRPEPAARQTTGDGASAVSAMERRQPRAHAHPGFFLVLDGPDGGGKTTQADRLADWLRSLGLDVVACRDPGGTALGNQLRHVVMDSATVAIGPRAEMLLYMAARAQLLEEVIVPALSAAKVVVSDRYLLANIVYQGTALGLLEEEIAMVGMVATAGVLPDLTIVLDVPTEVARARVGAARDRIEARPDAYHDRVRQGFLAAARGEPAGDAAGECLYYPAPIAVVDGSAEPERVFRCIQNEVSRVLALGSGS